MKKHFIDFFIVLLMTCLLGLGANKVMDLWLFRIAFPETLALEGFQWEDFAFKLRPDRIKADRIILVNIGEGGRREIAGQIETISQFHPKVIGLHVFFNCENGLRDSINCPQLLDTLGNAMLSDAIQKAGNVVMVSKLLQRQTTMLANLPDQYDSIEYSDEIFNHYASHGYGNIPTRDDINEFREIWPQLKVNQKSEYFFSTQIAMQFDPDKTLRFLNRNNDEELVNVRGNVNAYNYDLGSIRVAKASYFDAIDYDSVMKEKIDGEIFENKIVLLGYLGDNLNDPAFEDKWYTAINATFAGKSLPDMLGIVLHANVISMILNEDYINELSSFWEYAVLFMVVSLNIILFIRLFKQNSIWYDSLCLIIPVVQIVMVAWLRMELLANFNFRLDLQGIIYLIAFVSFATNLYYGPISHGFLKIRKLILK